MSKKRGKPVTAEELLKELHADPEWVARKEAQEAKRQAWSSVLRANAEPVLLELRESGFEVETISDLFNRKEPWRKEVPIPPYPEAIPILLKHLGRPYHFTIKEEIARALTAPEGRIAFDPLVEEFRRTADADVAATEKRRAVELVTAGVGDLYTRDEVERITAANWESFRFALGNAIVQHLQKEQVPLVVELLRDEAPDLRSALADALQRKMRRWRRKDPEFLALVESLRSP